MSVFKGAIHWAGEHPVTIAVAVFGLGALFLLTRGGGSSSAASTNMSAFYAAQASQAQGNDAVALAQVQGTAATAIAQIAANRDTTIAGTQAVTATTLGLAQNITAQQGQKQQFFLDTGIQQIFGDQLPFLVQNFNAGGSSAAAALAAEEAFISGGTGYSAAH